MKTETQIDRDVNALIKLVLCEMEDLAAIDPEDRQMPYQLQERRRRVVRRIWQVVNDLKAAHAGD